MNTLNPSIDLLSELDSLSKIHYMQRDVIDGIMIDFGQRITRSLQIQKLSVWLFDQKEEHLVSMGEYDCVSNAFKKASVLVCSEIPLYSNLIREGEMIHSEDLENDSRFQQLRTIGNRLDDVVSLFHVPLRIGGEVVGTICYEQTKGEARSFSEKERTFALSVALVFASNLEARYRRAAQFSMERLLAEKEMLIREMNHRVKNNLSILISLLRISMQQTTNEELVTALREFEKRIFSMNKVHDLLQVSDGHSEVQIADYLEDLLHQFQQSDEQFGRSITLNIESLRETLPSKTVVHLGLVVTEILLNAIKHAFLKTEGYELKVSLKKVQDDIVIRVEDNSAGFDFAERCKGGTLGLNIIKDLLSDLQVEIATFPEEGACVYEFQIKQ